jgi:dGTPase
MPAARREGRTIIVLGSLRRAVDGIHTFSMWIPQSPASWPLFKEAEEPFIRDRDKISGSRALRRLAGKTQVIALPGEPLVRSRLTHTLEVSSIARELGRALGMRDALIEAIALGHDLGHPAFGHAGEQALASLLPGGFHHAAQGVRVVTLLERMDLSPEVVDGILKHSKGKAGAVFARGRALSRATREAWVVRAADLFAYACHDLDDAFLLGWLSPADVPRAARRVLGASPVTVRRALVDRTVRSSLEQGEPALDPETSEALASLRAFLYERLYEAPRIVRQTIQVQLLFESLWEAATEQPLLFEQVLSRGAPADVSRTAPPATETADSSRARSSMAELFADTVATMTDRQLLRLGRELGVPRCVRVWPRSLVA